MIVLADAVNFDARPFDNCCAFDLDQLLVIVNRDVGQDRRQAHLGVMCVQRRHAQAQVRGLALPRLFYNFPHF